MPTSALLAERPVPRAARRVREDWVRLSEPTLDPPPFDAGMVAHLPEPARRYLTHAIAPGTPLWQSVQVSMVGRIGLGSWRRFSADQVVAPGRGYIWAAVARVLGVPVVGYDRLSGGSGEMRWRLLDLVPVADASGADVTRSAAGRLASEIVLVPTAFASVTWTAGGADTAVATSGRGAEQQRVELHLGADGHLVDLVMQRWGNPDGKPFALHPFGVSVDADRAADGVTTPSAVRAGWWHGTDRQDAGEFFRAEITRVEPR
ncbi:DUF6544 family protein [Microlunatus antarcticus]|uniref:Uncharacterized protein n=1 Tax=Microlunatus antarcticus TaxID=53388 RepID=A0A7W5P758_9ACTN|nr:DUF6544 family protein [Microlunatus antarcticus]MBB3327244.1 hypothetical protein [Microlunatus antarcticus]